MSATETVRECLNKMVPGKGERIADFARRMYYMQMEIYSSYAGRDLDTPFEHLPTDVQAGWINSAEQIFIGKL